MISFVSSGFEKRLTKAIGIWTKRFGDAVGVMLYEGGFIDPGDPTTHPGDADDLVIGPEDHFDFALPRDQESRTLSYSEFIKLADELASYELIDNVECWTNTRLVVRIEPINDKAERFLYRGSLFPSSEEEIPLYQELVAIDQLHKKLSADVLASRKEEQGYKALYRKWQEIARKRSELMDSLRKLEGFYFEVDTEIDGHDVGCAVIWGFNIFHCAIYLDQDYNDDFSDIIHEDLFVDIEYEEGLSKSAVRQVFRAYLFELSSSFGLDFQASPMVLYDDELWDELVTESSMMSIPRMRPPPTGRGLDEVIQLYLNAVVVDDPDIQILGFAKVIEHISQTVVKEKATRLIHSKLLTPRALQPDSEFISELEQLVEENRVFRKDDRAAVILTTKQCCDALELSEAAPKCLAELGKISVHSSAKEREQALGTLGSVLYATRNAIAHAKANFQPTGKECSVEQRPALARCAKLAAQQVIRWYQSYSPALRRT